MFEQLTHKENVTNYYITQHQSKLNSAWSTIGAREIQSKGATADVHGY